MKYLFLLLLVLPTAISAQTRKASSSQYYKCTLERDAQGTRPVFRKEFIFPFPESRDEDQVIQGSMRWNSYLIKFKASGLVQANLSEEIRGKRVTTSRTHQLGKARSEEYLKLKLELDGPVTYHLNCGPE